ncbi:MAG TPA: YicC/YloC family endoribonuclease [Spirochaetia bacterium]|nr:YicC/YloC family endoribonuclease [Spirochaetia bacterium]
MKSMTGYGYAEHNDERFRLSLDLRSYNSRYLEMSINVPPYLGFLESRLRDFLAPRIARGRVELYVRLTDLDEELDAKVDKRAVETYTRVLRELASAAGIAPEVRLDHLLGLEGVLKTERNPDVETYWAVVEPELSRLLEEFEETRLREGATTHRDVAEKIALIESGLAKIEAQRPELESSIKKNLRDRFDELLGMEADQARIMSETAVMLVKADIGEEIVRMKSHLESFRRILDSEEPVGKKLDFVCQELGREINTVGSKSTLIEINREVIEIKDALEKIREQLRNVE